MSAAIAQPIATQIVAVTVYRDRALIQRRGTVTWHDANTIVEVAGLPPMLQSDSIRVGVISDQVQIREVQVSPAQPPKPEPAKLQQIRQDIQALQQQRQQTADQLSTLKLQQNFVIELGQSAIQPFAQSLARQQTDLPQAQAFLDFVTERHQSCTANITELEQTHQSLCDRIQVLEQQLKDYNTPALAKGFRLLVHLAATESGSCELELSYLVNQASWEPCYDLCLTPDHQIQITYFGEVTQTSGEDWSNVAMQFSTAKPEEGNLPPAIAPWSIDIAPSSAVARAAEVETSLPLPYNMSLAGAAGSELPSALRRVQAQAQAAQKTEWQGMVCFPVAHRCTVPSDGNSHKVVILQDQYPCQLNYLAQPKQVGFAYTHAQVMNPLERLPLLPGKVNLFRGNTFVGSTAIAALLPGQAVDLSLGVDDRITLQRTQVQRELEPHHSDPRQRLTLAYRISLTNHHAQAVQVTVQEPMPVSKNDQVTVHLVSTNPPVNPASSTHAAKLLSWTVDVAAESTQELFYQFTVDCPTNLSLTECSASLSLTGLDG
ncbi:MAG: mucoidy inhibitor MuiA family protein [Thainema sp.]